MSKRSMSSLFAICVLLAAASASAGDAPKPAAASAAPGERHVQRIVVHSDGTNTTIDEDGGEGDDDFMMGGPGGERRVIVKRLRGGAGGAGCGEECGPGECGPGGAGGHAGMRGPGMMGGRGGRGGPAMMRGGMGGPGGPGGGMAMMAHRFQMLDLTDAQRDKMKDIHERQVRRGIQARADLQLARMDMRKLMHSDKPDAAALNAQIDRIAKLRADQQKSHVAAFLEARALLTPEQLKQFNAGPGKRPGMMGHPGMMMGHPGMMMQHGGTPPAAPGAGKPDSQ